MDALTSTLSTVLALSIFIVAAIAALVSTWRLITIITRPIATWFLHLKIFVDDEHKSRLESAQAGVTFLGMFLCISTAGLECAILGASGGDLYVQFENVHVTVSANLGIAAGKGVVEGVLTLGVLSAVVKGSGLGQAAAGGEVEAKKKD